MVVKGNGQGRHQRTSHQALKTVYVYAKFNVSLMSFIQLYSQNPTVHKAAMNAT